MLELLYRPGVRPTGRAAGLELRRGGGKKLWIRGEAVSMSKADFERLWERVESIREDLASLADEIARLYDDEDGLR